MDWNVRFNTITPAPANINPLGEELSSDPAASAVWNKVKSNITTMAGAFDRLSAQSDSLFAQLAQIEANTRLAEDAKAEDKVAARNKALEAIEALRRQCETAHAQVQSVIDATIDPQANAASKGNDATALLEFERVKAGWERLHMMLEHWRDDAEVRMRAFDVVRNAAERGDTYMVSGAREYLEYYLASRGWLMDHNAFVAQFNEACGAAGSPAQRAAGILQQTLNQGWANLQIAFGVALGHAKGSNIERMFGLPGWPGVGRTNI